VLGIRAGAKLGLIAVRAGKGYAKVKRRVRKWADVKRWARALRGIPLGNARNLGRVRSKPPRHGRPAADPDADGVPSPLDIDDDGDRILDSFDRTDGTRRASASAGEGPVIFSALNLYGIERTVNANAGGLTAAGIDAAIVEKLSLGIPSRGEIELDCGKQVPDGLPYCAPGGTGAIGYVASPGEPDPPFPACCDPDGNGFGALNPTIGPNSFLLTHATTAQIHPGDVIIERYLTNPPPFCGGIPECSFPAAVPAILTTVPALVSYADGAGNAATIAYPVPPGGPGSQGTGKGHPANPLPVKADADGHVRLTLTLWRPQRQPLPSEEAPWMDVGHLFYDAELTPPGPGASPRCPPAAYTTTDPNLALGGLYSGQGGVEDQVDDRPANPANMLTFTIDANQCLAAAGRSWNAGEELTLSLGAHGSGLDNSFIAGIDFELH
jgi:hypothetical protein